MMRFGHGWRSFTVLATVVLVAAPACSARHGGVEATKFFAMQRDPLWSIAVPGARPDGPAEGNPGSDLGGPGSSPGLMFRTWTVSGAGSSAFIEAVRQARRDHVVIQFLFCEPTGRYSMIGRKAFLPTMMQGSRSAFDASVHVSVESGQLRMEMKMAPGSTPGPLPSQGDITTNGSCPQDIEAAAGIPGKG